VTFVVLDAVFFGALATARSESGPFDVVPLGFEASWPFDFDFNFTVEPDLTSADLLPVSSSTFSAFENFVDFLGPDPSLASFPFDVPFLFFKTGFWL
jgi:hypothetical protein